MKQCLLKLWKKLPGCHYFTAVERPSYWEVSHEEVTLYVWAFKRKWDVLTFKKDW